MKEKYVPQFDYDNISEQEQKINACKQCEKTEKHKISLHQPNKELFEKWYYSQKRNKPIVFTGGALLALFYGLFKFYFDKKYPKPTIWEEFAVYNRMNIQTNNNSWRCPCCGFDNIGNTHCERCGVLPKLIEKTDDLK